MKEEALKIIKEVLTQGRKALVEYEAKQVLKAYDLPLPEEKLAKNLDEAIKYANEIGYPVVMKLMSPQILHKSDAKVVMLKIKNDEELKQKWEEIHENARKYKPDAEILGVLIAPMLKPGREIIIGVTEDPQFGHALMFGLGGIFVEILKDVTFRIIPIEEKDAWAMIKSIKGYPILAGARGEAPADMKAIVDMMLKVSQLIDDLKDYIKEMDLNPIFVYPEGEGAVIVDARIILK
ncbi:MULTISPECIES: acetate--CoA ligase family protein [Thermococcus]|uniref:acetate--CoA ligase (ADP-forming) n=1 Tax=Thermococcus sibiricus (strain DSM 12597 / MM 739) TaxID=604354 RepID=C6A0X8_THESM|nr:MULTISPECIES: acetate--CoA ligase family protein [Thermococcus]ACS89273.1 Acetyl-CoA synthetase II (ACSII, ADP-forming) and succinyl-CoA synthetase (SCS, ADP-forming), subunit beta [Thermococcus sibiricus MM 739]KUK28572.1 MAG: Acetyl-CoA synthetase II subunit beta [Thermococcus sp. 40_45]MBC7095207.1 acetate--CoA ligase family protein [Thermococcus sp.]HII66825.1 acetyl-CoA synthetase [Thermococcaceae archaeon]